MRALNLCCLLAALCCGTALASDFTRYDHFPSTARYGVVGAASPDGRLILWNGESIYYQSMPGLDQFREMATGYQGDPAFLILSPDGHTVLLGAGGYDGDPYLNKIYRYDLGAPSDYSGSAVVAEITHYTATFLTSTLVLIDAGAGDWANSVLVVLDISGAKSAPVPVVRKPSLKAGTVVHKPGYSAAISVDRARDRVYTMDAASLELRSFSLTALVNAYNTHSTLDWSTDGTLIGQAGQYFNGGVSGVTPQGYLLIGGALGWGGAGGVQVVNPGDGAIVEVMDPAGDQAYTSVIYNGVTNQVTITANGLTYFQGEFSTLPLAGVPGVAVLASLVVLFYVRRGRREQLRARAR